MANSPSRSGERTGVSSQWWCILILLSCLAARSLSSQTDTLKVGLVVTEKTDGLVESAFRTALSGLRGVVVVTAQERSDVLLRVVVLCQPSRDACEYPTNYAVAVTSTNPSPRYQWTLP